MTGVSAVARPPRIVRFAPNQRIIKTDQLKLTFDAGNLSTMEFLRDFDFAVPLEPYSEEWKNFAPLDGMKVGNDINRRGADEYLAAWEKRAGIFGARKVGHGDLLSNEYSIYSDDDDTWSVIGVTMGKSRRAGGGGLWADGWILQFASVRDAERHRMPAGQFLSISAFCDEFNTTARKNETGETF